MIEVVVEVHWGQPVRFQDCEVDQISTLIHNVTAGSNAITFEGPGGPIAFDPHDIAKLTIEVTRS